MKKSRRRRKEKFLMLWWAKKLAGSSFCNWARNNLPDRCTVQGARLQHCWESLPTQLCSSYFTHP